MRHYLDAISAADFDDFYDVAEDIEDDIEIPDHHADDINEIVFTDEEAEL